jgi:hypothetical protein
MTLENILVAIFCCFLFALLTVGLLFLIKFIIIYPLSYYYTKRGTNKLQWKATETSASIKNRLNGDNLDNRLNSFDLVWRILPSELPYIIRVYGYNEWEEFDQIKYNKFNNEEEFKNFVGRFKTYKDLREYYNKIDNRIVWYEP